MLESDIVTYSVQLHTAGFRWCGNIELTARRRLSDFINDDGVNYLLLKDASVALWDRGTVRDLTSQDSVAINKDSIIALFCSLDVPQSRITNPEHVAKVPQRVMVYAFPFAMIGNLYMTRDAYWVDALSGLRQNFCSFTDVTAWCVQSGTLVNSKSSFTAIRRRSIDAVHPVSPSQHGAARTAAFRSNSWARMRDLRGGDPDDKGAQVP